MAVSPLFVAPKPAMVDDALIRSCRSAYEAILLCWDLRAVKYDQSKAAALCEIPVPHFSNILAGKKYLPPTKITRFQEVMGNLALTQYLATEAGLKVDRLSPLEDEVRRLRHEVARMRGTA